MPEPPRRVREVLSDIGQDNTLNGGIDLLALRAGEFESPLAAKLAGVFLVPDARDRFDAVLDEMWAGTPLPKESPEIIVGGGLHAAIYCAVRVAQGYPKPLVIEASERAGGTFAVSRTASFYLNSANRPGSLGTPGRAEALNFLPGAPVQPADLGGDEYQTNISLAFAIRSALAMNAKVVTGQRVMEATSTSVTLEGGRKIRTARVIYATGLGRCTGPDEIDGGHMMDYFQFLSRLDDDFPLRGARRVAVVGAQDAGRTVIEALTGQGPPTPCSLASLDYVEAIDWYGVPESCSFKAGWRENNRSRYQGIGRLLPTEIGGTNGRVKPITRKAEVAGLGFNGAYVDGARYDMVIWATGFEPSLDIGGMIEYSQGGRALARMAESGVFVVGPAAKIEDGRESNVPSGVPENSVAVFRYADRTAALAMQLPDLAIPETDSTQTRAAVVTQRRRPSRKPPQKDKSDSRNWEAGDLLAYQSWVNPAGRVSRVEDGTIYIDEESDSSEGRLNRIAERSISVAGEEWAYYEGQPTYSLA